MTPIVGKSCEQETGRSVADDSRAAAIRLCRDPGIMAASDSPGKEWLKMKLVAWTGNRNDASRAWIMACNVTSRSMTRD